MIYVYNNINKVHVSLLNIRILALPDLASENVATTRYSPKTSKLRLQFSPTPINVSTCFSQQKINTAGARRSFKTALKESSPT